MTYPCVVCPACHGRGGLHYRRCALDPSARYWVAYRDCFGGIGFVKLLHRHDADALVAYLKAHEVAAPLYVVTARRRA